MTVLLHISDPHFGTERAPVVEALVALARQQRPDLVVLSGDITQRARRQQFGLARAFVGRLGAPVLALPGNHDIPLFNLAARLGWPYGGYLRAFGGQAPAGQASAGLTWGDALEPVFSSPDLLVIGVNTTRWYRHADGAVSGRQIQRVAQRLALATPGQLRLVVVHQPVAVQHAEDEHDRLHGHAAALARWAAAGADLVLGGHIHLPYVMALAGLARPMWAVQAGTAVSRRVRPGVPNSVNLLRWGQGAPAGQCRIEQWDGAADGSDFVCRQVTDVRPAAARNGG